MTVVSIIMGFLDNPEPPPASQIEFINPGTYTWEVPRGLKSIATLLVGVVAAAVVDLVVMKLVAEVVEDFVIIIVLKFMVEKP